MEGLLVILAVLLVGSYLLSPRDVFAPAFLTSIVWFGGILLYYIMPEGLPVLKDQFLGCLLIWSVTFVGSCLLMQSFRFAPCEWQCSTTVRDVYFWISICCVPSLLLFAYTAIRTGTSGSLAMDLRLAALGKGSVDGNVYTPFYYVIWVVTYMLYLVEFDKKHWRRTALMGGLVLLFGIITMAKALILSLGILTLFVLYRRGIITTKFIAIALGALLAFMLILHGIRQSTTMDEEAVGNAFEQYILRGFAAFDTLKPCSAAHWGENVFRLFYAVPYKLGFSQTPPIDPILPFILKPVCTNTYTTMYPFFVDFGKAGVGWFAAILGLLTGWVYKKSFSKSTFWSILYAYVVYMIIMQYAADSFFTNLAGHIKFVIVLAIPYVVGSSKLLAKQKQ